MAKIFLFGESHISKKDFKELEKFNFGKVTGGIVFREGRENDFQNISGFPFGDLFQIGLLVYSSLSRWVEEIFDRPSVDNFFEKKKIRYDFEYDNNIDPPLSKIYDQVPSWWKYSGILIICFFLFWIIKFGSPGIFTIEFLGHCLGILVFLIFYQFPPITLFNGKTFREKHMITHITRKIKKDNYDTAFVLCGAEHLEGLENGLTQKGHSIKILNDHKRFLKIKKFFLRR